MAPVRLLDLGVLAAAVWLAGSLVLWSGRSASFWARLEHVFLFPLGIVALRLLIAPVPMPALAPRRLVAVGVAVYALIFSVVTVTRRFTFRTHALDLGYYVQLTWNLARGHGPYVSLPEMHAWGDHLSPIMYLFVPGLWPLPGATVLLMGQSVAPALGALPVNGTMARSSPAAATAVCAGSSAACRLGGCHRLLEIQHSKSEER